MEFQHDAKTCDYIERLETFMEERILPNEAVFHQQVAELENRWHWTSAPIMRELQAEAREKGLWNLFLPGKNGAGLTNLQYAPLAEISGRAGTIAPAVLNCAAPDTGNMEVLNDFATPEQKEQWLKPLLNGEIRSGFAMTEPGVASSDATNIETSITRDGDHYVINGRKFFTTGGMNPDAKIFIVMGKTDPDAPRHLQQSQILVPRDTSGLTVERGMTVIGYENSDHGGHAEITFDNVRVPVSNLIGKEGGGFAIAQARLGPGRIHHCMRAIGVAERAIELMAYRAADRVAFGRPLAAQGVIRTWVAQSRIEIEQLRLLTLKTAWMMDTVGNRAAHREIQAIKIATPGTVQKIVDRAMQVFGGTGVSQDTPLAEMFAGIRTLRLADGPDEVHLNRLGRDEIRRYEAKRNN